MFIMFMLHRYWPIYSINNIQVYGLAIMLLALLVGFYCGYLFHKHKTAIHPFEDSSALISSWPYTMSRNPIYLMMTIFLFGFAVTLASVSCLVPIPIFVVWIHVRFVLQEEIMLVATFGQEYSQYQDRVRRWI